MTEYVLEIVFVCTLNCAPFMQGHTVRLTAVYPDIAACQVAGVNFQLGMRGSGFQDWRGTYTCTPRPRSFR